MRIKSKKSAFGTIIFALLFMLFLSAGCCAYINDIVTPTNKTTTGGNGNGITEANRPPVVNLTLNFTSGPAPFSSHYTYRCYDPDENLAFCELMLDGEVYAKGNNQSAIFPDGYKYPDFYWAAMEQLGNHTLTIYAMDSEGMNASKEVEFVVLSGEFLDQPGWYNCNEKSAYPPCDYMYYGYCDKIVPRDVVVREAAADAVSKHPGAFSINQLLDIYDWMHTNVFYHNVPIDMWPPYPPSETLTTKSGDCKNQAVVIASMVEAIGGSARVLYIPECRHAFAEVYLGNNQDVDELNNAIWAHYPQAKGKSTNWHYSKNENNETENWFIFDTAGGWFPGNTIPECLNASRVYVLMDCFRDPTELNAPEIQGTEYGPYIRQNDTQIIQPGWSYNYWTTPWISSNPEYEWCHYKLNIKSLSTKPMDWYLTNKAGYDAHQNYQGFNYYYGEEQVQKTDYEFDWDNANQFYVIIVNNNADSAITVRTEITETCHKG
ncbi:MAG: transglutaminase-like domain-containing protein [Candidatus Micrarchaeia archaeon]